MGTIGIQIQMFSTWIHPCLEEHLLGGSIGVPMLKWGVVIRHNLLALSTPPTITMAITITIWKHCSGPERGVSWVFIDADYILASHHAQPREHNQAVNYEIEQFLLSPTLPYYSLALFLFLLVGVVVGRDLGQAASRLRDPSGSDGLPLLGR